MRLLLPPVRSCVPPWRQDGIRMLGHFDAGFTLRTYTHATRQKQDEAAAAMGSFMEQVL